MKKNLSKYGNSFAVLIDKPILELLNITPTTELKISTDGNRIIIEPIRAESEIGKVSSNQNTQKSFEKITQQYKDALDRLSKN